MVDIPAPSSGPRSKISQEAKTRFDDAKRQKDAVLLDLKEAYFFTRPRMFRNMRADTPPGPTRSANTAEDGGELVTAIGTEVAEDFGTELLNGFFPPNMAWVRPKPAEGVPPEVWKQVKDQAEVSYEATFQMIRDSNFNAEIGSALVPEGAIGTVALWIDEPLPGVPVHVQHVPIFELEINVGPRGEVDDRFAVRWVRWRYIKSVIGENVEIPEHIKTKLSGKPNEYVRVTWGFWRDWSKPRTYSCKRVLMLGDEVIDDDTLTGEGCCPLLVMRFAPDGLHSFGNGPTIDALPDLRVIDVLSEAQQNRAHTSLKPSFTIPDDGVMNIEGGIEDGKAYVKRPGGVEADIMPLFFQGDVNLGLLTIGELEHRVRRKHFADYPEQAGKTPPTATQWLDEMAKSQRRIGTPGQRFFHEGPAEVFKRFRYLGLKRQSIPPVQINGRAVSMQPDNPASRAQEQQEAQVAVRLLEILKTFFPQTFEAIVDQVETMKALKEKFGDRLVTLRSQEQAAELIREMLAQAPALADAVGGGGGEPAPEAVAA